MLEESTELRDTLEETTAYYRKALVDNGFDIIEGTHPCVPVMLYDEKTAAEFAAFADETGYATGDLAAAGCTIGVSDMIKAATAAATVA